MPDEVYVNADNGFISDDSSFYGAFIRPHSHSRMLTGNVKAMKRQKLSMKTMHSAFQCPSGGTLLDGT